MLSSGKFFRCAAFGAGLGAALIALPTAQHLAAQTAPPDAAKSAKPRSVTLADALAKADLGRAGLALAVGADKITLTETQAAALNLTTVSKAAVAYNRATRDFGGVMALGPLTYTELLTDFSRANPFADMPPRQAFTLLMGSLDDRQRTALLSKTGLGLSDLTTDTQKQIFEVLLPDAAVTLKPRPAAQGEKGFPLKNLRERAASVHFRLAQEVAIQAEVKGDPATNQYLEYRRANVPPLRGAGDPVIYDMSSDDAYTKLEKVNGVVIRRDVPNRLKPSALNYNAALQAVIPIADLKTVGSLIQSVAKKTGIELYCDPSYDKRSLTWVASGRNAASASELLRALAFCVAGTYRRVGPAYTLTEDLVGMGTRRQIIQDFEEECNAQRYQAIRDAEKKIKEDPAQKNARLDSFGDPLAMTPEQEKTPPDPRRISRMMDSYNAMSGASLPFDKLTPGQQQAVQSYEAAQAKYPADRARRNPPDFEKNIHVLRKFAVQMVVSGLDGVVSTDFSDEILPLFRPEPAPKKTPEEELNVYRDLPKWTDAAKAYERRAIICRPLTTADVDASLTRIAALGFNQMWLTVFENGKARIPGTPFPLDPGCDAKVDLLTYAIDAGRKKGITVSPLIHAFLWGADAPPELQLRTLRGENSAQSARRRFNINSQMKDATFYPLVVKLALAAPSANLWVDPTDPATQAALMGLLRAIRTHAGVGVCVFCDVVPKGFAALDLYFNSPTFISRCANLGYNPALRLAFLRKNHRDPIDIFSSNGSDDFNRADTSLSQYTQEGDAQYAQNVYTQDEDSLMELWLRFCEVSAQTTQRALVEALTQSADSAASGAMFARDTQNGILVWFDLIQDAKAPFSDAQLFGNRSAEEIKETNVGRKSFQPGLTTGVFWLSKLDAIRLPKEIPSADMLSLQIRFMRGLRKQRNWDGVVVEE